MTEEELTAIEERANAATPGPWRWSNWLTTFGHIEEGDPSQWRTLETFEGGETPRVHLREHDPKSILTVEDPVEHDGNRRFIAHARTDVPALVAEVRRLRRWKEEYRVAALEWDRKNVR